MVANNEDHKTNGSIHYKDWPNEAGFNASDDHKDTTELVVTGKIPDYAAGLLFRTGPGGYKATSENKGIIATSHWFDGFARTHRFEIIPAPNGTRVTYSSLNQVDELIESIRKTGRRQDATFGQKRDPCDGLFKKIKSVFVPPAQYDSPGMSNIGVAIRDAMPSELQHIGADGSKRIMSLTTDTAKVKQFDLDTLEPLGVTSQTVLHPALTGPLSSAHACHDGNEIYNYNLSFVPKPTYKVFRSDTSGNTEILATISGKDIKAAYLHSLMLSEHFVILCIWPAHFRMGGASILWTKNLLDAIDKFDPKSTATWVVIDRRGRGVVKKFTTPAFFCFHTVNAWEEPGANKDSVDVVCELIEHNSLDVLHWFYYENMVSSERNTESWLNSHRANLGGGLARYRLHDVPLSGPASTSVSEGKKVLSIPFPDAGDLPRINPHYTFREHRYVYSVTDRGLSSFVDAIGKTDTQTKTCLIWEREKHTPGEPIFLPRPGAVDEDDGVVLSVVLNGETGESYLLCLDARTLTELGRADVGHPIGLGFHGAFLPSKI